MDRTNFEGYLLNVKGQKSGTAHSRVSICQRIDNEYDIDAEYAFDKCASLLDLLSYSKKDAESGVLPSHNITIDGNLYTGTSTLKYSLKLYVEFKEYSSKGKKSKRTSNAKYCGDYKGFLHFINGYCRNLVNTKTKTFKKGIVSCEYCGKPSVLESAHRRGEERPEIIKKVLNTHFKKSANYYEVDLIEFEKLFVDAQTPYEDHFYFLCKKCHSKYDKGILTPAQMKAKIGR